MFLTTFLNHPGVKLVFKQEFPLQKTRLDYVLKAQPVTSHHTLVGTAFDYLLRFFLERKNPNCITKRWVAENSVEMINADDPSLKFKVSIPDSLDEIRTSMLFPK